MSLSDLVQAPPNKQITYSVKDADIIGQFVQATVGRRAISLPLDQFKGCKWLYFIMELKTSQYGSAISFGEASTIHQYPDSKNFILTSSVMNMSTPTGAVVGSNIFFEAGFTCSTIDIDSQPFNDPANPPVMSDGIGSNLAPSTKMRNIVNSSMQVISEYSRFFISFRNPASAASTAFLVGDFDITFKGVW